MLDSVDADRYYSNLPSNSSDWCDNGYGVYFNETISNLRWNIRSSIGFASAGLWGPSFALVAGILGILAHRVPTNNFIAWHYILVILNELWFAANYIFIAFLDSLVHWVPSL